MTKIDKTTGQGPAAIVLASDPILEVFRPPLPDTSHLPEGLREDVEASFEYLDRNIADSTKKSYEKAWQRFVAWARQYGHPALPAAPEVVITYASHLARTGKTYSTICVAISAIGSAHDARNIEPNPIRSIKVKKARRGIARAIGTHQIPKKDLTPAELRRMLDVLPDGLLGMRDRALLLLWYNCASRRSEPTSLNIEDVRFAEDGMFVLFLKTKTDQEGKGQDKAVPYSSGVRQCPVRAVKAWINEMSKHGHSSGPLFRAVRGPWIGNDAMTPRAAVDRIKRYGKLAGFTEAEMAKISGHSLRSGFATAASRRGRSAESIMAQTGHKSMTNLMKYIRAGRMMRDSAAVGILDE